MGRKAGILLAISALPSKYGIGDFGPSAFEAVDLFKQSGLKIWQILPLNPLGYGSSPYQPYSSFAGDELYISFDFLKQDGLLDEVEVFENESRVDYDAVRRYKQPYLITAYNKFISNGGQDQLDTFVKETAWVLNYAKFITFKKNHDLKCWNEWQDEYKYYFKMNPNIDEFKDAINYEIFIQYIFKKQWMNLKAYANQNGLSIMGDIPIYVSIDSQDVWESPEAFLLDDKMHPTFIAGVPPDYFSATGQRWGNPLYDWDYLEKTDFGFWVNRIKENASLFDIIRIDHFRAFDTYWKIPASEETAMNGEWVEAPGYKLFDKLYAEFPDVYFVAEDLGDLRPEVLQLRDHYNLKGMKIMQYTFDPNEKSTFEDKVELIGYTGTHDNQTLLGWYKAMPEDVKNSTMQFLYDQGYFGDFNDMMTYHVFNDICDYAIVAMQDVLKLDDSARFNTPGTVGSPNWEWKMNDFNEFKNRMEYLSNIIKATAR